MSKKPKVVASYGDPKKPKRWAAKVIRREFSKEVRDVHGDEDCHICGMPKAGKGNDVCSYPHGMVPAESIGGGMWTWKTPE